LISAAAQKTWRGTQSALHGDGAATSSIRSGSSPGHGTRGSSIATQADSLLSRRGFLKASAGVAASVPALGRGDNVLAQGADRAAAQTQHAPLVIARQGSFAVGGTVLTTPGVFNPFVNGGPGQTLHGDHLYTQFQVPMNPRKLPLVMWHGGGQMGKTWESTTDGREGFQSIFLRRD